MKKIFCSTLLLALLGFCACSTKTTTTTTEHSVVDPVRGNTTTTTSEASVQRY